MNKKEAFDFFGFFKDIDHECYEEGCTFDEVVDHYGHKEKSVRFFCGGFFFLIIEALVIEFVRSLLSVNIVGHVISKK